jgi:hypothetical protein
MFWLWTVSLSLFAFILLIWLATRIAQWVVRRSTGLTISTIKPERNLRSSTNRYSKSRRPIIGISFEELENLLQQDPDNLLILDLRMSNQVPSLPVAEALVLTVTPSELTEILIWIPPNRSIVFCGPQSRWQSKIMSSPSIEGTAPFYFLDDNFRYSEVA